jgi:hypothetical protein
MRTCHLFLLLPVCLLSFTADAATWPGPAPCDTSLQACIDAQPAGAEVIVDSNGPIDEAISFGKSLSLRGASGRLPRFAAGRSIRADFSGNAAVRVSVARLALRDGAIELRHFDGGGVDFHIEDVEIESSGPSARAGIYIGLFQDSSAARSITLQRNRLRVAAPSLFDAAAYLLLRGQDVTADLRWNRIEAVGMGDGWGVMADVSGSADVDLRLFHNEVRGGFGRGGIQVSEGLFSASAPSSVRAQVASNAVIGAPGRLGGGIHATLKNGSIDLQAINNTVTSSGWGLTLLGWGDSGDGPPTGSFSGRVFNNLVAYNRRGMEGTASLFDTLSVDYNLVYGSSVSPGSLAPGANGLTTNPQLVSIEAPRLRPGSPAIGAGNSFALLFVPGSSNHDADGLRRLVGTSIDSGAYEFGHRSVAVRKASATAESFVAVADAQIDADRGARLFPTVNFRAGGVANPHPLGVFDLSDQWWVRNTNGAAMAQGTAFNLFSAQGTSATGLRQHTATGANTFSSASRLEWSVINDRPDHIALFAEASGFGATVEPSPLALSYSAPAGRWELVTTNGAEFTTNTVFNLYAQAPSPNAFRHTVATAGKTSVIDHPLLNGNECARAHVSALAHGGANGILADLEYVTGSGRWRLYSNPGDFSAGAQFNIVVVPEQIEQCTTGRLFRDSFEAQTW